MADEPDLSQRSELPSDRRQFFLRGLGKTLEGLLGVVEKASPIRLAAMMAKPLRRMLRPPGALTEEEFLKTCYRCGSCVDACKPKVIKPIQDNDQELSGTPYIDPDLRACEMCSDLPCVQACPSRALQIAPKGASGRVAGATDGSLSTEGPAAGTAGDAVGKTIRLGLAKWDQDRCLRTAGQMCQLCIERCPVGLMTLHLNARGRIEILENQCLGCGVCQQVCPARPKAIYVQPL